MFRTPVSVSIDQLALGPQEPRNVSAWAGGDIRTESPGVMQRVKANVSICTAEKNAGRIEKGICRKIRDISWLNKHKWPGLQAVFSIERCVEARRYSVKICVSEIRQSQGRH